MTDITIPDAAVEAFKAAWHAADDEGRQGNRVSAGLAAAAPHIAAQALKDDERPSLEQVSANADRAPRVHRGGVMSALTDRIAAEHGVMSSGADGPYCGSCGALIPAPDGNYTIGHARHIATVTEAAVRERVARDIVQRQLVSTDTAAILAYDDAAKIARGGAA